MNCTDSVRLENYDLAMVREGGPWHVGGIEQALAEICKRLKNDLKIVVCCTGDRPSLRSWQGLPVYVFRAWTPYRFSRSLYEALNRSNAGLVHARGFATFIRLAKGSLYSIRISITRLQNYRTRYGRKEYRRNFRTSLRHVNGQVK